MLNQAQILTIDLLQTDFFYMCPLPIAWDARRTKMKFKSTLPRKINLLIFSILNIINGCGFLYAPTLHYLIAERKGYTLGFAVIHLAFSIFAYGSVFGNWILWTREDFVLVFNKANELHTKPQNERGERFPVKLLDEICVVGAICVVPFIIIVLFAGLWLNMDPLCFVIEDLLGDPIDRSIPVIVGAFILRMIIGVLGMLYFFQLAALTFHPQALQLMLLIDALSLLTTTASSERRRRRISLKDRVKYYKAVKLTLEMWLSTFDDVLSIIFSLAFWLFCVGIWVVIAGKNKIPPFFHTICVVLMPFVIFMYYFILNLGATVTEQSRCIHADLYRDIGLGRLHNHQASEALSRHNQTLLSLSVKAIRPPRFYYKPFLTIDTEERLSNTRTENSLCKSETHAPPFL